MTQAHEQHLPEEVDAGSSLAEGPGEQPPRPEHATGLVRPGSMPEATAQVLLLDPAVRPANEKQSRPAGERSGGGVRYSTRRLAGLDGLRAIAVLSVVIFHLDFSVAPGGFLGVDVFFVISGFLITNLVATEILETGRLRLGRFYMRRARRLLPTVLALLLAVYLSAHTLWRDQLATLKGGVVSSLTYVTNWWLIADHQPYFTSSGRPSMLQHLWSLAIEEQFYLVWSGLVVVVAAATPRRRRGSAHEADDPVYRMTLVVRVALGLAATTTLVMAAYAVQADLPYGGSTTRAYFGSDTHSMGLFLGSAAGAWWALHRRRVNPTPRAAAPLVGATDAVGLGAVAVLVYQFFTVDEFSPQLYRGGFLAFDALALLAIVCAIRQRSFFGRLLDIRPIRWLGQRSYSIYIWHWPVVLVTRPGLDVPGPVLLVNLARLVLILSLSALSYHFIEVPLRSGQFARWRRDRRTRTARRGELIATLTTLAMVLVIAIAANPVGAGHPATAAGRPAQPDAPATAEHHQPVPSSQPRRLHSSSPDPRPSPRTGTRAGAKPSLSAFGDSVLLGAAAALRAQLHRLDLDAVEGRQPYDVLDDIARDRSLAPNVLIHIGNNGIISPDQLISTLRALSDRKRVLLANDRVARDWQDPNNQTIRVVGSQFRNVLLVNWFAQSSDRPSWLFQDGLHLTASGVAGYTAMVVKALHRS